MFVVEHLKSYTDKLLSNQLKANELAFVDSINELTEDVSARDKRVKNLVSQLATSTSSSNSTIDSI